MMTLHIFVNARKWRGVNPIELAAGAPGLETEEKLEIYGRGWAGTFEDDLVMLMRTDCHGDGEQHCCCDKLDDCNAPEFGEGWV